MTMFPHRDLTEREHQIMDAIRRQTLDFYTPLREQLTASADLARVTITRAQEIQTQNPDADLSAMITDAQEALQKAEIALADLDCSNNLDNEELAFLAGQQDGLYLGITLAARAFEGMGPNPIAALRALSGNESVDRLVQSLGHGASAAVKSDATPG